MRANLNEMSVNVEDMKAILVDMTTMVAKTEKEEKKKAQAIAVVRSASRVEGTVPICLPTKKDAYTMPAAAEGTYPARIHSLVASAISDLTLPRLLPPGPDDALRAFSSTPSARTDVSLSALLSVLLRAGRLEDLKSTFHSTESSLGVAPGRASHNVLLHTLLKSSQLAAARQMLDEMANKKVKHRPSPDIISYNTVLAGYSTQDDEEGFEKLLKEINASKLEPNVVTYNCRIQWFSKKGETFKGEELLDVMESTEVAPNYLTHNALVQGYCKEGNVGAAMRVFKRMKVMKRREGRSDLGVSAHS